jgi:prefoldin subunit 5
MATRASLPIEAVFSIDKRIKALDGKIEEMAKRIWAVEKFTASYADEVADLRRMEMDSMRRQIDTKSP